MPTVSAFKRQQSVQLHGEGLTQREISIKLGISRCAVQKIIQKHRMGLGFQNISKMGRPQKLSAAGKRRIVIESKRNPMKTANQLRKSLDLQDRVSTSTIKRVLCNSGLFGRVSCKKPALTKKNKRNRLAWCRNKLELNNISWNKIIFSDETKIEIAARRHQFVRRPPNKRYEARYVTGTKKFSPSIMLWGAIRADGCKVLLKCEDSVDQNEYQRLLHNGLPQIYSTRYILMHDGAPCHRARSTTEYLRQKAVRILKDWPAQSPDLNIIENLWQDLKLKVKDRNPVNVNDLWQYCQEEFDNISDEYVKKLYNSLPQRVKCVVTAKGGSSKY